MDGRLKRLDERGRARPRWLWELQSSPAQDTECAVREAMWLSAKERFSSIHPILSARLAPDSLSLGLRYGCSSWALFHQGETVQAQCLHQGMRRRIGRVDRSTSEAFVKLT